MERNKILLHKKLDGAGRQIDELNTPVSVGEILRSEEYFKHLTKYWPKGWNK